MVWFAGELLASGKRSCSTLAIFAHTKHGQQQMQQPTLSSAAWTCFCANSGSFSNAFMCAICSGVGHCDDCELKAARDDEGNGTDEEELGI